MENEKINEAETQSAPVSEATTPETKKKTSPWVWIIGGCLLIVAFFMLAMGALGWWGYRMAKKELQKQNPQIEEFKKQIDKAAKESDEWDKKSKELRDAMLQNTDMQDAQ